MHPATHQSQHSSFLPAPVPKPSSSHETGEFARARVAKLASNGGGLSAEKLERDLSDFFYNETRRRPMVFALIND